MANGRQPMKVVIINTEYVQTDATSFKSVVQELTGKDSRLSSNTPSRSRSRFYQEEMRKKEQSRILQPGVGTSRSMSESVLMKNLSFKDFERLLKEMPPVDDSLWNMEY